MITSTLRIASAAALVAISTGFTGTSTSIACAQTFSRPVIIMTGIVRSNETARPTSVKVSIREVGDTAREITCSTSNKETGKYLVILSPEKKYWVHLEGDSILTSDVLIATPPAAQTQHLEQDFTVALREADDGSATKASPSQN